MGDDTRATDCGHGPYFAKGKCQKCYRKAYNAAYYARTAEKQRETSRKWRADNPERKQQQGREWYAANRDQVLESGRLWREANEERWRAMLCAYSAAHADEKREAARVWREANPERSRETCRRWREANPEEFKATRAAYRARRHTATADFTAGDWQMIQAQFDHACFYCGRRDVPLVQEHMTPLARGGVHTASNIVCSCAPCNGRKYLKTAEEFLGLT